MDKAASLNARTGAARAVTSMNWVPLDSPLAVAKIESFVKAWKGTPYLPGNKARGVGVDCAQLAAAFVDHMFDLDPPLHVPRLSPDTAVHNQAMAYQTLACVRRARPMHYVTDNTIRPGDVAITRSTHDITGPEDIGHAMIVLPERATAIHAYPSSGVTVTTLSLTRGIIKVLRFDEIGACS